MYGPVHEATWPSSRENFLLLDASELAVLLMSCPFVGSVESVIKSQAKILNGGGVMWERNSRPPCLLVVPAFDCIAGLYNRHLNSNRGICLR